MRRATHDDSTALAGLLTELGYPNTPEFVANKLTEIERSSTARVIVEEESGIVLGFLTFDSQPLFHQPGSIGSIMALCVTEHARGQGVGRRLIAEAERIAIEAGCIKMSVASGNQRTHTHQFYRSLGYEESTKRFVKQL